MRTTTLIALERLVRDNGHAIWVRFGYVLEPVRKEIEEAEMKSAAFAIKKDYKISRLHLDRLLDVYQRGRESLLGLYAILLVNSTVSAVSNNVETNSSIQSAKDSQSNLVLEGFAGPTGLQLIRDELKGESKERDSCLGSSFGVYPDDASSRSRCHSDVRPGVAESYAFAIPASPLRPSALKRVAIGVPVTSNGMKKGEIHALLRLLLPSFLKTVSEAEFANTDFTFILGYDNGDVFFEEETDDRKKFINQFNSMIAPHQINLIFVRVPRFNRVAMIWNILFDYSIRQGHKYFYQVNDDLSLLSPGWLTYFTKTLDSNSGLGIVGPSDTNRNWNCTLLTQAMVTPVHQAIFGYMYPPELKNWTSDRWITEVYKPSGCAHCRTDIQAINGKEGRRYNACDFFNWMLYVDVGRMQLAAYMARQTLQK